MTVRESIVAAIVTALQNGANKPAGCSVFRSRTEAVSEESGTLPAMLVYCHEEQATIGRDSNECTLTVRIDCIAKAAAPADSALDPLLVYAQQAILQDAGIAGLIQGFVSHRISWEVETGDEDLAAAFYEVTLVYRTVPSDPSTEV